MSNEVYIPEDLIKREKKPKSWGILLWVYFTDLRKNNPDIFEIQILSFFISGLCLNTL